MPVSDLLGKRARTASGVEVGAPTVRSFFRALDVFGSEIGAVRAASRQVAGGLSPDQCLAAFFAYPDSAERAAYVLDGLGSVSITQFNSEAIANAILPFVVPLAPMIDELLGNPDDVPVEPDDVDQAVQLVLVMSERLHIDPMAIMDWPLGLFLDARLAFSRPARSEHESQVGPPPGFPTVHAGSEA